MGILPILISGLITVGVLTLASAIQRITGTGLGLVAIPILVLHFGPTNGVLLAVVTSSLLSIVMIIEHRRLLVTRRIWPLVLAGLVGVGAGGWLARRSDEDTLVLFVGLAALFALVVPAIPRFRAVMSGQQGAWLAGGMSGFLHVTSGLSGPPLIAYGATTRWPLLSFVTSIQVAFLVFNVATLLTRGLPDIDPLLYIPGFAGVIIGSVLGGRLRNLVRARTIRTLMYVIAWSGVLLLLGRAFWNLFV